MSEPTLLVVAGCNGSGKSSFSSTLVGNNFRPFDYDFHFLNYYQSLLDIDIREEMAHNMAFANLENQIFAAIAAKSNFCYETNFNSTPLYWPRVFKTAGYRLELIYLCLHSIEEAKRRVAIRVQNGGHFVPDTEIVKRYFEGFSNLNSHYSYFDIVDLFDTSAYGKAPTYILSVEAGIISPAAEFPHYLMNLLPDIVRQVR